MVFVLKEEAGGWIDHYQISVLASYMPLPLFVILLFLVTFVIAFLLLYFHKRIHRLRKKEFTVYYQETMSRKYPDILSAISALAYANRQKDKGGELIVPRRILLMISEKYQSDLAIDELYQYYIKQYDQ